jgi:hypothetical protein
LDEAPFFGMTAFGAAFAAGDFAAEDFAATGFVAAGLVAAFGFTALDAAAFLGAAVFFTEAGFLGEAAALEEAAAFGAVLDKAFLAPVLDNTEVARGPFLSLYRDAESDAR